MQQVKILSLILLLTVVLLFVRLGAVSVFQVAEARNSQCAVEMMQSGNYVVPRFNGKIRFDKPPLHYYFMTVAYRVAGVSEGSARFFSSLCGLLVFMATWLMVNRYQGAAAASVASLVLLSSLHVIFQFRLATPDPYLIACHVISLYCFYEGLMSGRKGFFLLMYVLWGLAILSKGPVGLLLPVLTVFLFLLFTGRLKLNVIWSLMPMQGFMVVLLIALPWFVLVHRQTAGEWTAGFFVAHNLDRFKKPVDGHSGGFYLPLVFLLGGLFPFGLLLPRTLIAGWKTIRQQDWLFFNLLAAAVIIISYSVAATKLVNYIAPAYPFTAVLIAGFLANPGLNLRGKLYPEWILLLTLAVAIPVGIFIWLQSRKELHGISSYAWLLSVLFFAALAGFILSRKSPGHYALGFVAGGSIMMTFLFIVILYPAIDSCGSVSRLRQLVKSSSTLAAYRSMNDAFVFYHGRIVPVLMSARETEAYLDDNPGALIMERSRVSGLSDSLPHLSAIATAKDLFSSQMSIFYKTRVAKKNDGYETFPRYSIVQ